MTPHLALEPQQTAAGEHLGLRTLRPSPDRNQLLVAMRWRGSAVLDRLHSAPAHRRPFPASGPASGGGCADVEQWTTTRSKRCGSWHRPALSGGCPPNTIGAAAFHNRVRDGSVWVHCAMDTRNTLLFRVNPENCIGYSAAGQPLTTSPTSRNKLRCLPHSRSPLQRQVMLTAGTAAARTNEGQALGLLVLLRFTHYCAST